MRQLRRHRPQGSEECHPESSRASKQPQGFLESCRGTEGQGHARPAGGARDGRREPVQACLWTRLCPQSTQ